ncbi:hypothetical protein [Arsenophonus endosymbiont of Aleurodicus floccissimus]|uniref:hypothetical protein n=1 Tax=Arsenophonus endosymbiont of Aleurodicus floccissimus TaxID=2152761 RepID=UPI000E6AF5E7|nr:hypothetical protein [Arsenophonus endosymbiont of Aleurodicus floccissimus]
MFLIIKKKLIYTTRILIFAIGFSHTAFAQSDQLKVVNDQPQTGTKSVINKTVKRQLMDDKVNINTASEEELAEKLNGDRIEKSAVNRGYIVRNLENLSQSSIFKMCQVLVWILLKRIVRN